MSQEQETMLDDSLINELIPRDKLQNLICKSIDTLENILSDDSIVVQDRIAVAFKILEIAGLSSENSHLSIATENLLTDPGSEANFLPEIVEKTSSFLPVKYLQINNFLSNKESKELLKIALSNAHNFVSSTTSTQETDYRKSVVLYANHYPDFYHFFKERIIKIVPSVWQKLNMSSFEISELEMQMTAHNDGCFYKLHNDSGSPDSNTRELTYVYYFYKQPKRFSGGELKLYDTNLEASYNGSHGEAHIVEPRNNSIVFFKSIYMHEVLPISCPSLRFEDSRFTLNGWLRRK